MKAVRLTAGLVAVLLVVGLGLSSAGLIQIRPSATPEPPVSFLSAGEWAQIGDQSGAVVLASPSEHAAERASMVFGERVLVLDGAVSEGSASWIPVQVGDSDKPLFGWIRQLGIGGPLQPAVLSSCPASPNVLSIVYLAPAERLMCYGSRSLSFPNVQFEEMANGAAFSGTPEWLAGPLSVRVWGELGFDSPGGPLTVAVRPGVVIPTGTGWYGIAGHFRDDAADHCSISMAGDLLVSDRSTLWCREQLVITAVSPADAPRPSRDAVTLSLGQAN